MRDPMFDPEMMMDIIRRRESGFVYDASEVSRIQHASDDIQREEEDVTHSIQIANKKYILNPLQIMIATPIILLLSCGILVLMFLLAVCHIALLPPILMYDWWTRRKRVLKKVSPKVHISRSLSSKES